MAWRQQRLKRLPQVLLLVALLAQLGDWVPQAFLVGRRASLLAVAPVLAALPNRAGAAVSLAEANEQLASATSAIDSLLKDLDGIKKRQEGDVVRSRVGGKASPINLLQQRGLKMASSAEDPGTFTDAMDEFMQRYGRLDSVAYSVNFIKDGRAGDPKVQNADNYFNDMRTLLEAMKDDVKKMGEAMGASR
mmetsp:Transcript_75584/g.162017  ORF Transcript_75584/g.162017 Transcript_75584/m.162017 type:complete len:191 (-) Transcript_75584:70-642(-)